MATVRGKTGVKFEIEEGLTIEPKENGVKITGEPESLGKAIYFLLTKPSFFLNRQSEGVHK